MKRLRQHGATMTEFVVIAPLIALIGLTGLQLAQMYQARLHLDYAAFEAARAGAREHANPDSIRRGFIRGLLPLLASSGDIPGRPDLSRLRIGGAAYRTALEAALAPQMRLEILTPGPADFSDFSDPVLPQMLHVRQRVIPNDRLDQRPVAPGSHSGHSIQEANRLRVRIVWGVEPKIPLTGSLFITGASWLAGGADPFRQALLASGRVPLETEVSLPMLTPAIEYTQTQTPVPGTGEQSGSASLPGSTVPPVDPGPGLAPDPAGPIAATDCPDGDLCCTP